VTNILSFLQMPPMTDTGKEDGQSCQSCDWESQFAIVCSEDGRSIFFSCFECLFSMRLTRIGLFVAVYYYLWSAWYDMVGTLFFAILSFARRKKRGMMREEEKKKKRREEERRGGRKRRKDKGKIGEKGGKGMKKENLNLNVFIDSF
jgi:hypothetical protein